MSFDKRPREYIPPIGDFRVDPNQATKATPANTYADINGLLKGIAKFLGEVGVFRLAAEQKLSSFALAIDPDDSKLVSAHEAEWPTQLGPIKDYLSYSQYKSLRFRDSASASYLRTRFEEATRDVTGTAAMDLLTLAELSEQEALLIREFINDYIGEISDSSEFRTLEQFQDWLIAAVALTRKFSTFLETGVQNQVINPSEIERTTSSEAQHGQALFKVRLNEENNLIEKDMQYLDRYFTQYAPVFYNQFLGPALDYRLNVGARSLPTGSRVSTELQRQSRQMDYKLKQAITDQVRRRTIFEEKTEEIFSSIERRDSYKSYIKQLSVKGKDLPTNIMKTEFSETAEEVAFFRETEYQSGQNLSFGSSHQALSGREADDAHPQYLIKDGDTITGKIMMGEEALIDGMRPSLHAHSGSDGTTKIRGEHIEWNSLVPETVDESAMPPAPTDLEIIGFEDNVVPPGVTAIDADLKWNGEPGLTYEIQIAMIGDAPDVVE